MTTKCDNTPSYLAFGEDRVQALFLLAGIQVANCFELANGYWPKHETYAEVRDASPWWLVRTQDGDLIQIGWRKRVIAINWGATEFKGIITPDDVTKNEEMVHAWGCVKALEYLTELGSSLRHIRDAAVVRGEHIPVRDLMKPVAKEAIELDAILRAAVFGRSACA